jgi:hypothetical protein
MGSEQEKPVEKVISEVYLHVSNSGLNIQVTDIGHGPAITFQSSSFGNIATTHTTFTDVEGLKAIRDMLNKAIAHEGYSKTYVHAAKLVNNTGNCSASDVCDDVSVEDEE